MDCSVKKEAVLLLLPLGSLILFLANTFLIHKPFVDTIAMVFPATILSPVAIALKRKYQLPKGSVVKYAAISYFLVILASLIMLFR